jgi:hypothetical protein
MKRTKLKAESSKPEAEGSYKITYGVSMSFRRTI